MSLPPHSAVRWLARAGLLACLGAPAFAAQDAPDAQAAPAVDATPRFSVQMPPGPLQLGQRFELLVRGPLETGAHLDLAELPDGVDGGATLLEQRPDGPVLHQELRVSREGTLALDKLEILNGNRREVLPHVELTVVLELPDGRVPRVADALPPPSIPRWPPWMIGVAAGTVLLLGTLVAWLVLRSRRQAPQPAAAPRPADVVAAEALARLRARLPRTHDDVPPFLTEVSDVLRAYVEGRFGVRAPESTTEEFLASVAARHDVLAGQRAPLEAFLTSCDLVKFAKHRPGPEFALPLLDTAERFVEVTRSVPAATSAPPGAAAPPPGAGASHPSPAPPDGTSGAPLPQGARA